MAARHRFPTIAVLALAVSLVAPAAPAAFPPSSANVDLVGRMRVHDAAENHVQALATLGDYAYLGAYQEPLPTCSLPGGVYVVDISDPRSPAEVAYIPNTQASFVYGGLEALHVDTPAFTGDVLIHTNDICLTAPGAASARGGISLWDVTDPRNPQPLALGVGDTDPAPGEPARAHRSRRLAAWDAGERAFAAITDAQEGSNLDILEITDPRNPRRIAETGIASWPGAQNVQSAGMGTQPGSIATRMRVRNVDGTWLLLVPYFDAGYVVVNVDDPANPVFVEDSDFRDPDPLTGWTPPEGNANYADWDRSANFIVGADQDLSAYRPTGTITSGPFSGERFQAISGESTAPLTPRRTLRGPTYYLGLACTAVPAAPSADAVAVVQRGTCTFQVKFDRMRAAGYAGVIVLNDTRAAGGCEGTPSPLVEGDRPFIFVARSTGYKILGITGYDPARCASGPNPALPPSGTRGSNVDAAGAFDGWGYVHLLDAATLQELDVYAPAPVVDERYAEGFGTLSARDVTTDPTHDLAYVAWSELGLRVLDLTGGELREVGHHIADGGADLYGVALHRKPDGRRFVLASDRDTGLAVFRFGTDLRVRSRARTSGGRTRVTWIATVSNRGTIDARETSLRLRLPRGVRVVSTIRSQGRCSLRGRLLACRLGTLREDATAQIRVATRATRSGTVRSAATVLSPELDYDPRNNRAESSARVARPKSGPPAAALTGRAS